ncbi:hypothetical protein [Curtobacterium sp. ISL-83]|uniref:hypothetical protein n=1 Tax=Curtobacterium sp. ISL-83 TaxID=2819145 RepID=UPI001BEA4E15|nr:hypothetical protein [Curtobacterium sp. ISL-83]MBT2501664.1 hypothetical protein [Curtobacterium sp. ISL-83]
MTTSRQAVNGLDLLEAYFGERLDGDLRERVKSAPTGHLVAFAEVAREKGLDSFRLWREEPLRDEVREDLSGELASETLLLDHKRPLSARPGLSQLLLLAPTVVVADPVWAWVDALGPDGTWAYGGAWHRDSTPPSNALIQVLSGLMPLGDAIRSGVVQLLRPPVETSIEMNRLFVNPTTHSLLRDAFPGWGLMQDEHDKDVPGSDNDDTLAMNLDYYYTAEERWEAMGKTIFPRLNPTEGVRQLRRAIALDDYAALNSLTPAPSPGVEDFLQVATKGASANGQSFKLDLPIMNLTLADALKMRGGEEVFSAIRGALLETIRQTGSSVRGESVNEYASRMSAAARDTFAEAENQLRKEQARSFLLGSGLPAAAGVAFGVGMKMGGLPAPGGPAGVRSGLEWVFRKRKQRAEAAKTALQYATNVRLSGHL